MRKLLLLALLLYDIVALGSRPSAYDDYDVGNDLAKRHAMLADDSKRGWRRKAFMKQEVDHKEYDDRRRSDYEGGRYYDDVDKNFAQERMLAREPEMNSNYRRRYEDVDKLNVALGGVKSAERGHPTYPDTQRTAEPEKKAPVMNCERPHERYEPCFAGCASVSCDNPRDRLRPCYPFCEPGCVCVPPYVRDDRTHKCILPDDCTKGLKGIPDLGDDA